MLLSSTKKLETHPDALGKPKMRIVEKYAIVDHEEAGLFDSYEAAREWFELNIKGEVK
jgi:hypothetical protein